MTSTSTSTKSDTFRYLKERWDKLDARWRFSIQAYLLARVALSAWAFALVAIFPLAVTNLDSHGQRIVTAFELSSSERAVFSRITSGMELHFRPISPNLSDGETGTVWDLSGNALSGVLLGSSLYPSAYSPEDIFPYRGVVPSQNPFLAVWQRFDANWYLRIARIGYMDDGSSVYFPLYPFLIRVLGTILLQRDLLAAMVISNLALVGALYLLYDITADRIGEEYSKRTIAFFLLFPTAFFLIAPYTESLFLLFALVSLREGRGGRWYRAGVFGALAALTRLQGVLMIVPLTWLAWREFGSHDRELVDRQPNQSRSVFYFFRFAPLLLMPLSTLAFLAYTRLALLNAYESQLHARFVFPWENLAAGIMLVSSLRTSFIDVLNLIVALIFGAMVAVIWIKLSRELGLYSLVMYLAPLFRMTTEQPLVSMARYALAVFPAFIVLSRWARNVWIARAITFLSLPLQLFLSAQFVMWGWVG
jgi:mannosyltransferase PIG-V